MPMQGHQTDASIAIVRRIKEHRFLAVHAAQHDRGDYAAQQYQID